MAWRAGHVLLGSVVWLSLVMPAPLSAQPMPGAAGTAQEQLQHVRLRMRLLREELQLIAQAQAQGAQTVEQQQSLQARAAQIAQEMAMLQAQERSLAGPGG